MGVLFLGVFAALVRGARVEGVEVLTLGVGGVVALVAGGALVPGEVVRVFAGKEVAGEDAVHGCVLDVDVDVGAFHGNDDVEVELEFVAYALFDGEVVGFGACPPRLEFGECEGGAEEEYYYCPFAASFGG